MIKIITDSSCDLSKEITRELDITVVPLYVRFGDEVFRERVDITDEQFYDRLVEGSVHPSTIAPSPGDFIKAYEEVSKAADGIVSIHISSKMSGTLNSAIQAKSLTNVGCPIEMVDSQTVCVALGTVVIAAAEAAKKGKGMEEVLQVAREAVLNHQVLGLLDTLKFLQIGGRIGKAQALVGTMLNIKPIITVKDGGVVPYGRVRSFSKGLDQLLSFVQNETDIEEVLIAYATTLQEAKELADRVSSFFTSGPVRIVRLGTTMGVHVGPGAIIISVRWKAPQAIEKTTATEFSAVK